MNNPQALFVWLADRPSPMRTGIVDMAPILCCADEEFATGLAARGFASMIYKSGTTDRKR